MTRSTSKAAFAASKAKAPSIQERAYHVLKGFPQGLTADEIAAELNLTVLSVRPEVTHLFGKNRVYDSGSRRPTASGKKAIVWIAL